MYVFHTHIHTFTIPYTPHISITHTYSSHTCAHISQYNGLFCLEQNALLWFFWPVTLLL